MGWGTILTQLMTSSGYVWGQCVSGAGGECVGGGGGGGRGIVVVVGGSTVSMHAFRSESSPSATSVWLSCRFVQRAPLSFLQSAMCKPLLCCAIAACSLDHKDANASVMKFLSDFIKCAREKEVRGRNQMACGSEAHLDLKGTEENCKCSITGLSQQTVPPEEKC